MSLNIGVEKCDSDSYPIPVYFSESSTMNCDLEKGETYYITIYWNYEYDYSFIVDVPSSPTVKIGDVNGDGSVNSIDFANLRMFLLGMIGTFPYAFGQDAADINGDSSVNSIDFAILRQYLLGMIDTLKPNLTDSIL